MAGYGTGSGTSSSTVLTLVLALPCLALTRYTPYMHSSQPVWCAPLGHAPATPGTPRVHPGTAAHWHCCCHRAGWCGGHLGSLWAAPVDRLAGHVAWPANTRLVDPLIGTHCTAPCVSPLPHLTASNVIMTLLWSTFCSHARGCHIRPGSKPV